MESASSKTHKIELTKVQETLLIPLYARALDYRSKAPILNDEKADQIVRSVDYDFEYMNRFGDDILAIRARHYDDWLREFLKANPDSVVLNAGCGLDARIVRINPPPEIRWFDLDYPEVIELRKNFYSERDGYRMIASPLTDPGWLRLIPEARAAMFIADGVLEYLTKGQVGALFHQVTAHFPHGQVAFDVMTPFAIRSAAPQLHDENGPLHKWAVEDLSEADALDLRMKRVDDFSLFASPYNRRLRLRSRFFYGFFCLIPRFKKMLRLLRYEF